MHMMRSSHRHARSLSLLATAAAAALLGMGVTTTILAADPPATQPAVPATQPATGQAPSPLWHRGGVPTTQPADGPQMVLDAATQPATEIKIPASATQPARTRPADHIKLKFQDAKLNDVVDYLSEELG